MPAAKSSSKTFKKAGGQDEHYAFEELLGATLKFDPRGHQPAGSRSTDHHRGRAIQGQCRS
jgi:hypothetical protein